MGIIKKVKEAVKNVIKRDAFDAMAFEGVRSSAKIESLCDTDEHADLAQDVFSSFYKLNPEVDKQASVTPRQLLEQLHALPEFKELKTQTQLDDISSALGTVAFGPELMKQMVEVENKRQEKIEKDGPKLKDVEGAGVEPGEYTLEELLGEDGISGIRQSMRNAVEQAQEEADQYEDACRGWGIEQGELERVPFAERFELAQKLVQDHDFKEIADLVGRFRNIVNAATATVHTHGHDEITDIVKGKDLGRLCPTELLKLKRNKALFFKDYLQDNLAIYNMRGTENQGKGPIIVCLDISGSMTTQMGESTPEKWSKAVTMALMALAEKQDRAFGFVTFERDVRDRRFWPKKCKVPFQDKLEIISINSNGGGTNFEAPLRAAFDLREKDADLKPADIVFITDGACRLSEEAQRWVAEQKLATDVRIYGILIPTHRDDDGETLSFCDHLAVINSLGDISAIKDMVSKTATDKVVSRKAG